MKQNLDVRHHKVFFLISKTLAMFFFFFFSQPSNWVGLLLIHGKAEGRCQVDVWLLHGALFEQSINFNFPMFQGQKVKIEEESTATQVAAYCDHT